jgi:lysophospholipase L1-like esterase
VATLGAAAKEHVEKNAALLEEAFSSNCGELGHVVNAIWDSPASEYIDPVHLSPAGRQRFAAKIAAVARPYMGDRSS